MISEIFTLPVKILLIFMGLLIILTYSLAIVINYQNYSTRNSLEAYALGLSSFAQKNAGFNSEGSFSFEDFNVSLLNKHNVHAAADIELTVELINNSIVTSTITLAEDGSVSSSGSAIGLRLQKGEKYIIKVYPYYSKFSAKSADVFKGKAIVTRGTAHGYIKEQ